MPVIYKHEIDEQTTLAVWKIEEQEQELISGLQLKQHELDFIASLNKGKRLLHWLSTRLLLRTLLNTSAYIDVRMDDHGKPFLSDSSFHISLSHSYDYAAVMIGRTRSVGVDIEMIKPKIQSIKQKFLSLTELGELNLETNSLYISWCAKEAIYKWYGKKGLEFRKHIRLLPFIPSDQGELQAIVTLPEGPKILKVSYFKTQDGYMTGYIVA
ncbi:4'-phosphopantetheinyl transferase family protein [Pedobacter antarcticus]|uniref:4'-phosphopantetheinyl transferase n=2 Tax=Pedobacter antarcticus TaxID=34086 RepID=A0A081PF64_9SPHI|nr:4'-phosphopantetheinyl transferase superfamily protein [Pedobacter antarcticus]KEQ29337.1 4'-phosphopantetheinyl transferase [Pedobacter antarcticus 4BY]SDL96124.1 4'-phosphopantetheinyl transferase superfamily protein [Pedobacter antarcticus]SFE77502.1 4'-phosphopantetheinyl transferase superfamily protein [Pedobacter antarcticus]